MDKNKVWNRFYFESHKAEIEQIINQGFSIPKPFAKITPSELKSILLIPSFLIQDDSFKKLHSSKKERNLIAGKYQSLTRRDLIDRKETSRNQLELIHESLSEIFKAVSEVIKDELRQDLKRIIDNSIASPGKKVELIENLSHKADDLKSFFGIEYASKRVKSGGLIFGTNVDDCMLSIQQHGSIETTLEGSRIPQDDELSNIQTVVSLNKLRQYQELALPYAEQFLGVQIALRYKELIGENKNSNITKISSSGRTDQPTNKKKYDRIDWLEPLLSDLKDIEIPTNRKFKEVMTRYFKDYKGENIDVMKGGHSGNFNGSAVFRELTFMIEDSDIGIDPDETGLRKHAVRKGWW